MSYKSRVVLIILITLGISLIVGYYAIKNTILILPEETITMVYSRPNFDDKEETALFYKRLEHLNSKIAMAEFFAKLRIGIGYDFLARIIKNLYFCEETEYSFMRTYEALGYLGMFDQRAADILAFEFKPEENPTRAVEVLRGLSLSKNMMTISKVKEKALKEEGLLSEEEKTMLFSY